MKFALVQATVPNNNNTTFNITDSSVTSDWQGAILFGGQPTANTTTTAGDIWCIGAVDSNGHNACLSGAAADATSAAASNLLVSNTKCYQLLTGTGGTGIGATYSATISNGVTLHTNGNASAARLVNAILFSGSDVEFGVTGVTIGAATSTATITHNLTAPPDCVLVMASTANTGLDGSAPGGASIGFFDSANSIGLAQSIVNAANPTNLAARCATANLGEYLDQTPSDGGVWSIGSVHGLTLDIKRTVTGNGANVAVISWRHLSGNSAASAFSDTTPAGTGLNTIASGMLVQPQLWLSIPTRLASSAFTNDDTAGCWGFSAAVNNAGTTQQGAIAGSAQNAVSASSVAKSYISNTQASLALTDTGTVSFQSTVSSWTNNGLIENVGTGAAGARIHLLYGAGSIPQTGSGAGTRRRPAGLAMDLTLAEWF